MQGRPHAADVVAILVLAVFIGLVGTGLGVAAAHVRSSGARAHGPLRMILPNTPPSSDVPSLQRDRVRLRPGR
jgi:hypothetical protein